MAQPIPNETSQPDHVPAPTVNPHVDKIMRMNTLGELQTELEARRELYHKWRAKGDGLAMKTQTRFAQIVHHRARELSISLS